MSKSKRQGTAYESKLVKEMQGFGWEVERLAEGGSSDLGDLRLQPRSQPPVIIEAKHREGLSVHREMAKAKKKAGTNRVALFWKRTIDQGKAMRQPIAGQAEVVIMDKGFYYSLLEDAYGTFPDLDE